jgi:hypothetical protein
LTTPQDDIRRLLRSFGIQADEAIGARLGALGGRPSLRLRLVVEDLTDHDASAAAPPPRLIEVEGEVRP